MTPEDFHRNTHRYKLNAQHSHSQKHTRMPDTVWLTQTCFMKKASDKSSSRHRENPRATNMHRDTDLQAQTQTQREQMQAHRSTQAHSKTTHRNKERKAHRSINPQGQSETGTTQRDPQGT